MQELIEKYENLKTACEQAVVECLASPRECEEKAKQTRADLRSKMDEFLHALSEQNKKAILQRAISDVIKAESLKAALQEIN